MKTPLIVLAILFLLAACNTAPTGGAIPGDRAPTWIEPSNTQVFTSWEILIEASQILPDTKLYHPGGVYKLVSYEWLEQFVEWTWYAADDHAVIYSAGFNCVEFTNLFNVVVALKARQAGSVAKPLAGAAVIDLEGPEDHAMSIVATDRGIVIVEPQPQAGPWRITPLAKFKHPIRSITLGMKGN